MNDVIEDAETEVAAAVIEDLLLLLREEKRATALAIASKAEATAREEREKHGGFRIMSVAELTSLDTRHWNRIMRFKARMIYAFVRDITNSHSKEVAGRLLFQWHHGAPGSGRLEEYLDGLPQLAANEKRSENPNKTIGGASGANAKTPIKR